MSLVICYQIADIIDRSQIEDICKRHEAEVADINGIPGLDQLFVSAKAAFKLIVLNLPQLEAKQYELTSVVEMSKCFGVKTLGKYPHMNRELASKAVLSGVDYIVPNSKFRATLESLLSS